MSLNEALVEIARIQQVMNYGLIFIAFLDFLGLLMATWAFYITRDIHRRTDQLLEESKQVSFYLFGKLGPLDMK